MHAGAVVVISLEMLLGFGFDQPQGRGAVQQGVVLRWGGRARASFYRPRGPCARGGGRARDRRTRVTELACLCGFKPVLMLFEDSFFCL